MNKYHYMIFLLLLAAGCKQAYEPEVIKVNHRFLVVEGVINTKGDSKTTIQLSRTRNLSDTFLTDPEKGAHVQVEAKSGRNYTLSEQTAGTYSIDHLTLSLNDLYRLRIQTSNGTQYVSDFVEVKQTPPIDSITWKQEEDVTIYVNTRDPSNKARYYRWDFIETWQYHAFLQTNYGLGVLNGRIFFRDTTNQVYNCWLTQPSTDIVIANSTRLADDIIDHFPVTVITKNSEKLNVRYTTLVSQYALTEEAYNYWDILRKNTQTLGTLFDAQPGQLKTNLHNLNNPNEPVIGFVSACNVEQKRIFIDHLDLFNWQTPPGVHFCQEGGISQDPNDPFIWNYPDTSFVPWYFISPSGIMIAKKECVDCRLHGGTNQKPSFWQ